jgi:hypothetical protein
VTDINVETSWDVIDINFHDQIQWKKRRVDCQLSVPLFSNQLSVFSKPTSTPSFACAKVVHIINHIEMTEKYPFCPDTEIAKSNPLQGL